MTPPIFILGMTKRSGTNFLRDLLVLHPDCHGGGPIWENYLLERIPILKHYADATYSVWDPKWRVSEKMGERELVYRSLGDGLLALLNRQLPAGRAARLVTKSPSVENLPFFFHFFPDAPLLILVRDGRAVAESTAITFGRHYEIAFRDWNRAGQIILTSQPHLSGQFLVVHYEALAQDTRQELTRILTYLQLDVDRYDFDAAEQLPVRGSSTMMNRATLNWKAVEKPDDFAPTRRWANWSAFRHARFNHVAGQTLQAFGYIPEQGNEPNWWLPAHVMMDAFWYPVWRARRLLVRAVQWARTHGYLHR